jgi:hypothetical protein
VGEADLVGALAGPDQATLDAAVSGGVLTTTEATGYLTEVQAQLTAWVNTPQNAGAPSADTQTAAK